MCFVFFFFLFLIWRWQIAVICRMTMTLHFIRSVSHFLSISSLHVSGWGRAEEAERTLACSGLPESGKTRDLSHPLHPCEDQLGGAHFKHDTLQSGAASTPKLQFKMRLEATEIGRRSLECKHSQKPLKK